MPAGIIYFFGVLLSSIITSIILTSIILRSQLTPSGSLIIKSDAEGQYLFVELNDGVDKIKTEKHVTFKVKPQK